MTGWGEVSYRVKRAISFHERFTIGRIADSTGLTYEQVEQVVHRLAKHGDVRRLAPEELTEAEQGVEKRVGRPRARYALSEDPAQRAEFLASLEAVAAVIRLESASERRPDTPYYVAALKMIEATGTGEEKPSFSRLREAEELLLYGREYEALVPEGLEVAQAYYDLALARLKMLDRGFAAAEQLLEQAGRALAQAGLEEEADRVAEWRLVVGMEQELAEVSKALDEGHNPLPILRRLRGSLRRAPWTPLRAPLCSTVELLIKVMGLSPQIWAALSEVLVTVRANAWALQQQEEALARIMEQPSPEPPPARDWPRHFGLGREDFEAIQKRGILFSPVLPSDKLRLPPH